MEQVLHLFITNKCRHNCPLCCNKFYEIDKIPVVTVELLKSVQTVCLTGGEPLGINTSMLGKFINNLRKQYLNVENLYIYTSGREAGRHLFSLLCETENIEGPRMIDGINFAPKDFDDTLGIYKCLVDNTKSFYTYFKEAHLSNRLYVFPDMEETVRKMIDSVPFETNLNIIGRTWDNKFNTPKNEHFVRLPILF